MNNNKPPKMQMKPKLDTNISNIKSRTSNYSALRKRPESNMRQN